MVISIITQVSASNSILSICHISHLKMDLTNPYHTLQKWISKSHITLSGNRSHKSISRSSERNIKISYKLTRNGSHKSISHFWSFGNADNPLFTCGIWKYLFRVVVDFETISHSSFAPMGYVFQIPLIPSKDIFISHS